MNPQFSQPQRTVAVEVNKQSIARDFGVKHNQVAYLKVDLVLDGYKVVYDKATQLAWALDGKTGTVTSWSVENQELTLGTSAGNYVLNQTNRFDTNTLVKSDLANAVNRSLHSRNADWVNVTDFGAIADGTLHPLSEIFSSLSLAQVAYPFVTSLTQSIDWAACQSAFDTGKDVYIPQGIYVCNQELEVLTHGQHIYGSGRGYGYNSNVVRLDASGNLVSKYSSAVFNYRHATTLLFTGEGSKRIRTRVLYRGSSSDSQDAGMSVCLNIQAEGTVCENFCVFLDIVPPVGGAANELNDSIDNLGSNWDVGIFVGCRCNTKFKTMAVVGYHRMANIWFDVTQAINLPRFNSWRGNAYPQGPVENGADGCSLNDVFTSGGLWGVNVQGPKASADGTSLSTSYPYYDELLGATTTDARGTWGFSDFLILDSQIFGANHHTRRRLVDMKASPDVINDWNVGGAFNIDGVTANVSNSVHGHRYIGTRFQSNAPFCVRIDRSARDAFFGCMVENPNFAVVKSRNGDTLTLSDSTAFYGLCASSRHHLLSVVESQAPITQTYTPLVYGDLMLANASTAFPIDRMNTNRLEVLSADATTTSEVRLGTIASPSAVTLRRATTGTTVLQGEAGFILQNAAGDTRFQVAVSGNTLLYGNLYPSTDNTRANGLASNRWTTIYAASGTINTSDGTMKEQVTAVSEAELRVAKAIKGLLVRYKFKDAVAEKGDEARYHFGVVAQDVKAAFEAENLDPDSYGLFCFDEWEAEYEDIPAVTISHPAVYEYPENMGFAKVEVTPAWVEEVSPARRVCIKEAGSRYGIRYDELLCFMLAAL